MSLPNLHMPVEFGEDTCTTLSVADEEHKQVN